MAAGSLPDGEVRVRFKVVLPPGGTEADDNARESCAKSGLAASPKIARVESPRTRRFNLIFPRI